ncbi:MAG: sel1 repeat family protein, partial [Coxiellaceae bacterium]|nr:sel1 repeat family protein [Coxiellaceae bacterium]
ETIHALKKHRDDSPEITQLVSEYQTWYKTIKDWIYDEIFTFHAKCTINHSTKHFLAQWWCIRDFAFYSAIEAKNIHYLVSKLNANSDDLTPSEDNNEATVNQLEILASDYPQNHYIHYALAKLYADKNDARCVKALDVVANHGHSDAEFRLGRIYQRGKYAQAIDIERSVDYFRRATSHGNAEAAFYLAQLFRFGSLQQLQPDEAQYQKFAQQTLALCAGEQQEMYREKLGL